MSDWDDLFAIAAGKEETAETPQPVAVASKSSSNDSPPIHQTKKRKRGSKRKANKGKKDRSQKKNSASDDNLYKRFLESRLDPIQEQIKKWPSWFKSGSSLIADSSSSSNNDGDSTDDATILSPMYRCLELDPTLMENTSSMESSRYLVAFTLLRDIRCCACCFMYMHMFDSTTKSSLSVSYSKSALLKSKKLIKVLQSSPCSLPIGELDIINEKFKKVSDQSYSWHNKLVDTTTKKKHQILSSNTFDGSLLDYGVFDEIIRLLVACDDAYYRLYYLQLSGLMPRCISRSNESISESRFCYIPHPTTYFGAKYLSWDNVLGEECDKEFMKEIQKKASSVFNDNYDTDRRTLSMRLSSIFRRFGLFSKKQIDEENILELKLFTEEKTDVDPLSFLYANRFRETILLFWKSGWVESKRASSQLRNVLQKRMDHITMKSSTVDDFYETHETQAPIIQKQWRDSCRDLLCNLYSYATLFPKTVENLKLTLNRLGITNGILEIGAGTGYISSLLNKSGFCTFAFDITPTISGTSMNEYHGYTPQFVDVQKGDVRVVPSILSDENVAEETALLLCYPPPLSSMAHDAVHKFLSSGGKCLIHIGEFKGLTGSSSFEKIVCNKFQLAFREYCAQWGSDSSEVTIWVTKDNFKTASSNIDIDFRSDIFIPCSNCQNSEANKHCRLSRSLRYCSLECFEFHKKFRNLQFSLNTVPACEIDTILEFENKKYFSPF